MDRLKTLAITSWYDSLSSTEKNDTIQALEDGQVIFFPELAFEVLSQEQDILTPAYTSIKSKNISFNKLTNEIRGAAKGIPEDKSKLLHGLLSRFANQTEQFIKELFPQYKDALVIGRTSFRPVEIEGRVSASYRKDDTRLHVDAFPANPNHGWRILRIFSNINPDNQPRVWRLGEPFEAVAKQFLPRLPKPLPASSSLLKLLKITKRRRTLYDHFMLQLHNHMKADVNYQSSAAQLEFHFPANATWIVQTDHVSHAAMSGQHLLEQTFYLPIRAMVDENKSPLRILESLMQKALV